jgi:hypothetical protein
VFVAAQAPRVILHSRKKPARTACVEGGELMAQSNPPRLSAIDVVLDAQAGVTEEDYYFAEYTAQEREEGLHLAAMKFVSPDPPVGCRQHSMFVHAAIVPSILLAHTVVLLSVPACTLDPVHSATDAAHGTGVMICNVALLVVSRQTSPRASAASSAWRATPTRPSA